MGLVESAPSVLSSRMYSSAHDYRRLLRRWRAVAKAAGLRLEVFATTDEYPVVALESRKSPPGAPAVYLSAGIHGDEPGATEGLITWAEKNLRTLSKYQLLIFPCLNPWGLVNNSRYDSAGRDLNRSYHAKDAEVTVAHIRKFEGRTFDFALTLHEDYDASGIYIYEVGGRKPYWAESMLASAGKHLPIESRRKIEGRAAAKAGIVRRKITPDLMPDWPEAFVLHFRHAARTFTIETPSEFDLTRRVRAQVAVIETAFRLAAER